MKTTYQILVAIPLVIFANASFANNWQWQLDQIKTNQKRVESRESSRSLMSNQPGNAIATTAPCADAPIAKHEPRAPSTAAGNALARQ